MSPARLRLVLRYANALNPKSPWVPPEKLAAYRSRIKLPPW